ncbi:MAG TPA: penicillin-binding protein 2 [Methylophilaceae bacterium]|jgi:cell division protein FtsI (penicillin-binding protein 3)
MAQTPAQALSKARAQAMPMRLPSWRRRALLIGLMLCFAALLGRAVYLQGLHRDFLQQKGDQRYGRTLSIFAHRGMITDRNNEPLAISTPVESVWASPPDVEITPQQTKNLAELLQIKPSEINKKIKNNDKDFIYLKRRMPPEAAARVMQLGIPGIYLQREYRRFYPAGDMSAHIIGFTGADDVGQEGVELVYQHWLAGRQGSRRVIQDRQGHIIEELEEVKVPQEGRDLVLSIDRRIQYLAHRELAHAVEINKAKAGSIIVLDSRTGEVLALANQPTYNPNAPTNLAVSARNRAIVDTFEPGSTLKPFTVATALEAGTFKPDTLINTGNGKMTIGPATINDAHGVGIVTVAQVIQKSSNVGAAKIALTLAPEAMWRMFNQMGFGSTAHIGFPGEASGRLRPWQHWRPIEQATMAYGHGISLSLIQLARAYTTFANDGEIKPISLLKLNEPAIGQHVISAKTAREIRDMLEMVVEPGGTAPRARIAGYRVAGKTGTAHKILNGKYAENLYVSSFIGMAPASNPRLIIAVMIDEPSAGEYYGGAVAAPVFANVMAGALRILAIPQDAPATNITPVIDAPEVKESV